MKYPLSQAAESLSIHPLELIRRLAGLGAPFEEIWPCVGDGWVQSVKVQDWARFSADANGSKAKTVPRADEKLEQRVDRLSDDAARLLEKMWRQGRWGDLGLNIDTIRRHYTPSSSDPDVTLKELLSRGLLLAGGPRGPFSLDPSRKREIERIATALVKRRNT